MVKEKLINKDFPSFGGVFQMYIKNILKNLKAEKPTKRKLVRTYPQVVYININR